MGFTEKPPSPGFREGARYAGGVQHHSWPARFDPTALAKDGQCSKTLTKVVNNPTILPSEEVP